VTSTDTWLAALEAHIGETEDPPGSNCCPVCRAYGPIGSTRCYSWCCALQDLALEATFGERLLQTAAVGQAMGNAIDGVRGLAWVPLADVVSGANPIRLGDLPCYDWGGRRSWADMHIEGVVNPYTQTRMQTIGGNVANRCDWQWRSVNRTVMGFIRPPFDLVVPSTVPPQPAPPQEATVDFMYVRRNKAGVLNPVYAVLDSGEVFTVLTFRSFEAQRKLFDGHNRTPQAGSVADTTDGNGDTRKVVLTDETGAQFVYRLPAA
jgi:hypothetical protein